MLWPPGCPLVIGGVTIEHEKGCVAHSDGDVLVHALCDAAFWEPSPSAI